ncbi:putative serine-threonine rich, partial [Golovinomyces cichoracearum]
MELLIFITLFLKLSRTVLGTSEAVERSYSKSNLDMYQSRVEAAEITQNGEKIQQDDGLLIWVNVGGDHSTQQVNPPMQMKSEGMTHNVVVGGKKGLVFEPEQIHAAVGDMVIFQFMSKNHTVTQSSFDKPCEPMDKGMDSGFMPNPDDIMAPAPQVAMQVTGMKALWFYCKQATHCGKGMTFSINPGPMGSGKTHEDFKAKAMMSGSGKDSPPPMMDSPPPMKDMPKDGYKDMPKDGYKDMPKDGYKDMP